MSRLVINYTSTGIRISGSSGCLERAQGVVEDQLPGVGWSRPAVDSEERVVVEAIVKPARAELISTILEKWAKRVAGRRYTASVSQGFTYLDGLPE